MGLFFDFFRTPLASAWLWCGRPKPYYFKLMPKERSARFPIGAVVKHRLFPFRGVVFDIDPEFANTEEWYNAIPAEIRPRKDQPFYHLFAENAESEYIAYVSEQNLLPDEFGRAGAPPAGERDLPARQGRQLPPARADAELTHCPRRSRARD